MDAGFRKVLLTLLQAALQEEARGERRAQRETALKQKQQAEARAQKAEVKAQAPVETDPLRLPSPDKAPAYPVGSRGYYLKQLGNSRQHRIFPPGTGSDFGGA